MDMLVPYTPVSELSEEQRKKLKQTNPQSGFVIVDGKVVSTNELRGLQQPPAQSVRQNLFEARA